MRALLVTNDFPPRPGGIERFVHNLAVRLPADSLVVYASSRAGAGPGTRRAARREEIAKFDADQPFEVVRERTGMLLPTPVIARRAAQVALAHGCDTVWFGAAAPLGLLAGGLRQRARIRRAVALTHGHETGWAALPGARRLLRRIGRENDVLTYLGAYTRERLARALGGGVTRLEQLAPGVDVTTYHPGVDGGAIRLRHGLSGRPVVVCVSRLVP
ncbi:MAG TPA: glycosyltransferase, partial [Pilimelia sp.]|nr:glycosyltransferase [Pilimelia sp.]